MQDNSIVEFIEEKGFDICGVVGSGEHSICYDVLSKQYNQHFVCKVISVNERDKELEDDNFHNKLSNLSYLIHPNVIQVFQTFKNETHIFIILEYCSNGDLLKLIKDKGPIKDELELLQYILNILNALSYLELNGIPHGNIKPSNIFLDKNMCPKVADFGLSYILYKSKVCDDNISSLLFKPPEVISRIEYDLSKADIWSFGVTIYYLATGNYPFDVTNNEKLNKSIKECNISIPNEINPIVRTIIEQSLVVNPEKRNSFLVMKKIVENEINRIIRKPPQLPFMHKIGISSNNPFLRNSKLSNSLKFCSKPYSLCNFNIPKNYSVKI